MCVELSQATGTVSPQRTAETLVLSVLFSSWARCSAKSQPMEGVCDGGARGEGQGTWGLENSPKVPRTAPHLRAPKAAARAVPPDNILNLLQNLL